MIAGKPGGADSRWTFKDAGGGRYRITNGLGPELTENTGTYFADVNGWKGSPEQKWEVLNITGDAYQIRISDQDCLTYHEDRKALGVWTCDGSAEQQWTITG
ncbi:RICIN domain-containing protein [Kitasatospora sp. NPDC057542]|uniref:RICIN domain-containing protein n=1 Tax=Kitasatospora sp. NPDC057542 TaxID=3346162 RepID=UPI0036B8CAC8